MPHSANDPIGFFDSGIGGLTVLCEAQKICPQEQFIYLADQARLPYGDKSPEEIQQYAIENGQFLLKQRIKLLVIACHTASSHALSLLRNTLPIPIISILESAIDEVVFLKPRRLAILGTSRTIQSNIIQASLLKQLPSVSLYPIACPEFVSLIEAKKQNTQQIKMTAELYLAPLKEERIDAALLACTHYPLIAPILSEILGPNVALINPANHCAQMLLNALHTHHLLNQNSSHPEPKFYTTMPESSNLLYVNASSLNHYSIL